MAKPNGPQAYGSLIEQSPNVVMGNPLIFGFLVDAMHQCIETWFANREEQYQRQKAAEAEGKLHFIKPELMKQAIEDCHDLMLIAKAVADGNYPEDKAYVVEDEYGNETVHIDYYALLKEYKAGDATPWLKTDSKIDLKKH